MNHKSKVSSGRQRSASVPKVSRIGTEGTKNTASFSGRRATMPSFKTTKPLHLNSIKSTGLRLRCSSAPPSISSPSINNQSLGQVINALKIVERSVQSEKGIEALMNQLESGINKIITSLENEENEISKEKVEVLNEGIDQLKQLAASCKVSEDREVSKLLESLEKMADMMQKMVNEKEISKEERQALQEAKREFLENLKNLLKSLQDQPGVLKVLSKCEEFLERLKEEGKDLTVKTSSKAVAKEVKRDVKDNEDTYMMPSSAVVTSVIIVIVVIALTILLNSGVAPIVVFPIMVAVLLTIVGAGGIYTNWNDLQHKIENKSIVEAYDELKQMLKKVMEKIYGNNPKDYEKYVKEFMAKLNKER